MCDCPLAVSSAVCHKISLQLTKHHLITDLALASLPPPPPAVLPPCHDIWTINNLMSTEYFINSHINIFHSWGFSRVSTGARKDVDCWGSICWPVSAWVNYTESHNTTNSHWHWLRVWRAVRQSRPIVAVWSNEVVFTPNYKHWAWWSLDWGEPASRHLYVWLVITIEQTGQLIKHQNRHFLLADGWVWLPVLSRDNYQRIPWFLPPFASIQTGRGLETDNPGLASLGLGSWKSLSIKFSLSSNC